MSSIQVPYSSGLILFLLTMGLLPPLALAESQIPELDPDKYTVCAITINSENERERFKEEIKKQPDRFNPIVELTEFGGDDWFEKACQSEIRCDQLVISGHFGGYFFGKSRKTLRLSQLEEKGCSQSCEGILSQPMEVFLFGCNTLATKEADHRTPEQYRQVLLDDGFSSREAELIVESRYGPTGDDNGSRMRRAFGGQKKQLFGFLSTGPRGENAEAFLKNYFKEVNLSKHLETLETKRMFKQVELTNHVLAKTFKWPGFTQCPSGDFDGQDRATQIVCGLLDERIPLEEKLVFMAEALSSEKYLTFVPTINTFLRRHSASSMTEEQRFQIAKIAGTQESRNKITALIRTTQNITMAAEWVEFGRNLDSFAQKETEHQVQKEEADHLTRLIVERFKEGMSTPDKDAICSLSKEVRSEVQLKAEDLNRNLDENGYFALGCLHPQDKDVQLKLLELLKDKDKFIRRWVAYIYRSIHPQDKEVQLKLLEGLKDDDAHVKYEIEDAIRSILSQSKEAQLNLLEALHSNDEDVRRSVAAAYRAVRPQDKEVQLKLTEGLNNNDGIVRAFIASAFIDLVPQDKEVQLKLLKGLESGDSYVRQTVAETFKSIVPQDKEVQLKLLDGLKSDDDSVGETIAETFSSILPQDKEVQFKLLDGLKSNYYLVSRAVAKIFISIRPQDKEVQLKLVEGLKSDDFLVRQYVETAVKSISPLDKDVQLKLVEMNTVSSRFVLEKLKITDKDVLRRLKQVNHSLWKIKKKDARSH